MRAVISVAALTMLVSSTASAQSYTMTTAPGSLQSIAANGTPLSFSSTDDGTASFLLPFDLTLFGLPVPAGSNIHVSTNGMISLMSTTDLGNDTIPDTRTPNGFVAAFWDDMSVSQGSGSWSSSGVAPSRVVTVEWTSIRRLGGTGSMDMQVKAYETTGVVEILHGNIVGNPSNTSGTVGIEGPMGVNGVGLPCGSSCTFSDLSSNTKLVFTPSGGGGPGGQADLRGTASGMVPSNLMVGQNWSISFSVTNGGSQASSACTAAIYAGPIRPVMTSLGLKLGDVNIPSLAAGAQHSGMISITTPSLPSGVGLFAALILDDANVVAETDESNNTIDLGPFMVNGGSGMSITVSTNSLPNAQVGVPYMQQLAQIGGNSVTWSVVNGSLPPGIALSTSGVLSGTPNGAGSHSFTVQAEQAGYTPGSAALTLEVEGASGFRITTTSLPTAFVGSAYTATIAAAGGTTPYAYQILSGQPSWLRLGGLDGVLSGTPDATGTFDIQFYARDTTSADTTTMLRLEVVEAGPLTMVTTAAQVPPGQTTVAYEFTFVARGGAAPYAWSVSAGALPDGLSLDTSSGRLMGTPTTIGESTFTVTVTDSAMATVQLEVTVPVTEKKPLRILVPDRINVPFEAEADFELTAEGGRPPYMFTKVAGDFPAGLALTADMQTNQTFLRGTATSSAAQMITLVVTDADLSTDMKEVTVQAGSRGGGGGGGGTGGNRGGGRGGGRDAGCACDAQGDAPLSGSIAALFLLLSCLVPSRLRRRRRPRREPRQSA